MLCDCSLYLMRHCVLQRPRLMERYFDRHTIVIEGAGDRERVKTLNMTSSSNAKEMTFRGNCVFK